MDLCAEMKWVVSNHEEQLLNSSTTPSRTQLAYPMLSYQTPELLTGRHQRQISTPTVFDTSTLHPASHQRNELHRRGLSLDQQTFRQLHNEAPRQDENVTNVEDILRQQLTQQTMREAQQQQQQTARPGPNETLEKQQLQRYLMNIPETQRLEPGPGYHTTNYHTAQLTDLNANSQHSLTDAYSNTTMNMLLGIDSTSSAGNLDGFGNGLDGFSGNMQPNAIMDTNQMPHSLPSREGSMRPTSREGPQRPCTPRNQNRTSYFPMTPETTPFSKNANLDRTVQSRTTETSPTRDPNATIKASHAMQRGRSCQDNFAALRQHAMSPAPSPQLRPRSSLDLAAFPQPNFFNMANLQMDIPNGNTTSNYSPESNAVSSTMSSIQSSPETTHIPLFGDLNHVVANHPQASNSSNISDFQKVAKPGVQSSPPKKKAHSRNQSVSEIDPLECIEETGVTSDEIASFISIQDTDNKWTCLYPKCGKKFARKENIKSHVQTHLNDRQFRCKECNKRFVRQHDLKRHTNVHSKVKSYICECGSDFARHDALTRHKQRGMCSGKLEGTEKKETKRGRPKKKSRPDTAERREKAAKTRQRVLEKQQAGQYASSVSDSSVSSYPSPEQLFDEMDFTASNPTLDQVSLEQLSKDPAADLFSWTPPTSPASYSTGNCFSSQNSQHSHTPKAFSLSPSPNLAGIPEEPQQLPAGPSGSRKSSGDYLSTPPELELSSSSPAASKMFDFDGSSDVNSADSMTMPFDSNSDFFTKDFDLSPSLNKLESSKTSSTNMEFTNFTNFFNSELELTGPDPSLGPAPPTHENIWNLLSADLFSTNDF